MKLLHLILIYTLLSLGSCWGSPGSEISFNDLLNVLSEKRYAKRHSIIFIYSPMCPHCKMFKPSWSDFMYNSAPKAKNVVYFMMDATKEKNYKAINEFNIQSFPFVGLFKGKKIIRSMNSGMADMNMGYSWLATASDLPPDMSQGMGFPLPIFAKQKSKEQNVNQQQSNISFAQNKNKTSWANVQKGNSKKISSHSISIPENQTMQNEYNDDQGENDVFSFSDDGNDRIMAQANNKSQDYTFNQDLEGLESLKGDGFSFDTNDTAFDEDHLDLDMDYSLLLADEKIENRLNGIEDNRSDTSGKSSVQLAVYEAIAQNER